MRWQPPSGLPEDAPRSPYAHWAWEQAGAGGATIPGYLSGDATGVAKVETLPDAGPPPDPADRLTRIEMDTGGR